MRIILRLESKKVKRQADCPNEKIKFMKKISILLSLGFLFLSLSAKVRANFVQNETVRQKVSYEELLAKLKSGDTKIDFKSLRMAYAETKEYSPYGVGNDKINPMFKALENKKYEDALKLADEILKTNYVEMNSHFIASAANSALGNKEKSDFHRSVFLGLVNSIVEGKDGKSAKTAYEVISVPEEYVILYTLGYKRGSQALVEEGGHKFDVLTVTDSKTNETAKLYFNVDTVFKGYGKIFGK